MPDFVAFHSPGRFDVAGDSGALGEQAGAFAVGLAAPVHDQRGVGPGLERGAVSGEFSVAFGDGLLQVVDYGGGVGLGGFELGQGVFDVFGVEDFREPGVNGFEDRLFFEEHVEGVVDVVGEGVFAGVAAAVGRRAVEPVALHLAPTRLMDHESFEVVGVGAAHRHAG
ncbi:hypothetical protein ACWEKT_07650 [Nocardia takedensis]